METLDITYVSDLFYPYLLGGAERQFYEIARRMAKRHNVSVITLKLRGYPDREFHDGMDIRRIGIKHPTNRRSYLALAGMLPSVFEDSEIVHANQGVAGIRSFRRGIVTVHDVYFGKWFDYHPFPLAFAGRVLEKMNVPGPFSKSEYITVSDFSKEKIVMSGISESKIHVIPNGIDTRKYRRRKKDKTILYVGRIVGYKRVEELIIAYKEFKKEHPEYTLKIIGEGPMRKALESKYPDVEFLGYVSEERKIYELSKAEIFANPSEVEGFGIVALEAMASGCKLLLKPLPCYSFASEAVFETDFSSGLMKVHNMATPQYDVSMFDWDHVVSETERVYLSSL